MIERLDPKRITAAVYARKSNEQDASTELRSITRQTDGATTYAKKQDWPIVATFSDDGISGALFGARRPGLAALLDAATQRPAPFSVVLMSEGSRLGREMIETANIVRTLTDAGVAVVNYSTGREIRLDTAEHKILFALESYIDESELERTRARVTAAMVTRARAGHVTGRPTYGYTDTPTIGPNGQRGPVVRRINTAEAKIVGLIFKWTADGIGAVTIAKRLNQDRIPSPRVGKRARRHVEWTVSAIPPILNRDLYRGEWVWNKTSQTRGVYRNRPESDWIRTPAPHLRIVSDLLWQRAHARRQGRRIVLNPGRKPHQQESRYLLVGIARCGACGATIEANVSTGIPYYVCRDRRRRGAATCANKMHIPTADLDRFVLASLEDHVLNPDVIATVLDRHFTPPAVPPDVSAKRTRKAIAGLDREIANLIALASKTGTVADIAAAIQERTRRRDELRAQAVELDTAAAAPAVTAARRARVAKLLRDGLPGLRILLNDPASARGFLRDILRDQPIQVWSLDGATRRLRVRVPADQLPVIDRILGDSAPVPSDASIRRRALGYSRPYEVVLSA